MSNQSKPSFIKVNRHILKIEDEEQDPLLNLGFKRTKTAPVVDQEQEVPVLHEEAPSITKKEQQQWRIPSAVSNWKNTKGFMIDLDKRMASSANNGDELDATTTTNRGFLDLSAALNKAERTAKENLRNKAKAREESERAAEVEKNIRLNKMVSEITNNEGSNQSTSTSTATSREQRRAERRKRAAEEMSKARTSSTSTSTRLRQLVKEQHRDVSERIILGASESLRKRDTEATYDSTLFLNAASSTGRDSSKNGELYDTPLFAAQDALNDIYRSRATVPSKTKGLGMDDDHDDDDSNGGNDGHGDAVHFVKDGEEVSEDEGKQEES